MDKLEPIDVIISESTKCIKCQNIEEISNITTNLLYVSSNLKNSTHKILLIKDDIKFYEKTTILFAALSLSLSIIILLSKYIYRL